MSAKRKYFEMMLDDGLDRSVGEGYVTVQLLADTPGVIIPGVAVSPAPVLGGELRVAVLNFSYRFEPRTLVIDDEGIHQVLSFSGRPQDCHVPWAAIVSGTTANMQISWDASAIVEEIKKTRASKAPAVERRLRSV